MFHRRPQSDFSEELRAHLGLEIERLRAEGLSEDEAYHAAHRALGNLAIAGERFYESSRWMWLEHAMQDTRQCLRRLRKTPAFTITAILTLALGIGATTSIFTLVDAVLLKSLPVANPSQLYRLGNEVHCCVWGGFTQSDEFSIVSYELYRQFRDHTPGFEELAAFDAGGHTFGVRRERGKSAAEPYLGEFVSGNYFSMFGIRSYAGRVLTAEDDRVGASPAVMMSYRVWQQKFGLDPSVIGDVFNMNGKAFTVVGVTSPGFFGDTLRSSTPDFFLPIATEPLLIGEGSIIGQPNRAWLDLIGRIRPGAVPLAIQAQMRVELQQWIRSHEGEMDASSRADIGKQTLYLTPGGAGITSMRHDYEHWLKILMMVSGFVLLIVCANVANLMLVRGMERRQQTSLSMALGARPMRIVRQALTESLILSLLGGAAGLAVAFADTRLILHFAFQTGTASPIGASPSLPVLLFAFGVSLFTGALFGILPAWMATRVDPVEALRGARATRQSGSLPRKALVVVQAALSLVLLSASGLLTQTLRNMEHRDFGFEQERRMILSVDPVLAGYKPGQLDLLYRRLHDSLTAIPGVAAEAAVLYSPQGGDSWNDMIFIEGRPRLATNVAWFDRVSTGYFETIGNRIIKGRSFSEQDTAASRHVAVVNESFAKKFFKGEDPIGRHFGNAEPGLAGEYEVIGVAKDGRYFSENQPFYFLSESQTALFSDTANNAGEVRSHYLHDIVISTTPGATVGDQQIRRAFAAVDPNLPVITMRSLSDQVASNFSQQRLLAQLTSLFGLLALVLGSIGLYGVTAYTVGSRTNEIGLRMALGAGRTSVVTMILRGAVILVACGLAVGIPLTLLSSRFLASQLFGVSRYDPAILSIAALALVFPALIAALIPALRASSISPIVALRAE